MKQNFKKGDTAYFIDRHFNFYKCTIEYYRVRSVSDVSNIHTFDGEGEWIPFCMSEKVLSSDIYPDIETAMNTLINRAKSRVDSLERLKKIYT